VGSPGSCSKKCIFSWLWVFIGKTILEEHRLETSLAYENPSQIHVAR
jgi:hypothetical protein